MQFKFEMTKINIFDKINYILWLAIKGDNENNRIHNCMPACRYFCKMATILIDKFFISYEIFDFY